MTKKHSYFSKNLLFIGNKYFHLANSKKLIKFNISDLARVCEVRMETVKKWIEGGKIHKTNLNRIAKRISSLMLGINITPDILLNQDIEELYFTKKQPKIIKDVSEVSDYNLNERIVTILKSHPQAMVPVANMLITYLIRHQDSFDLIVHYLNKYPDLRKVIYHFLIIYEKDLDYNEIK